MIRNTDLDSPRNDEMRRLLLLSPFAPRLDASMGGPRMIAQLVTALSRRNRIALLYLRAADEAPIDERVAAVCELTVETRRGVRTSGAFKSAREAISMVRGAPSWVREWSSPDFAMTLGSVAAGWRPDVVQAEFHLMGQYLPAASQKGLPTVLNQHEPGAAAAAGRRRAGHMPGLILPALDVRAWRAYERGLLRQADVVVTFTERDRQEMRALGADGCVEVIPPGAQLPAHPADPEGMSPPTVLFFGNYLHAPNVEAALRLARDIFPRLRAEVPDLRLSLPGDCAPAELTSLASDRIEVPGRVPDLAPHRDRAAVVVVPLRLGGGMRVKVLETLSAGKALVASPLAVEGLDLVDGDHLLFAQTDDEFVALTLRLLADPAERARLARQARAWAVEHLSWERAVEQYDALYNALIAATPAGRAGTRRGCQDPKR